MANLSVFDAIINYVKYLSAEKTSGKDVVKGMARASAVSNASLASRARLNVCQFPLLTSTTISTSTYQKASEILEQLYAQYLKLVVVNQLEVVNLEKGENKLSIIAKVHQNDNAMATNRDALRDGILRADISSRFESAELEEIKEALSFLEVCNFSEFDLKEANKVLLKEYSENFNLKNLNSGDLVSESSYDAEIKTKYDQLDDLYRERDKYRNMISETERTLIELDRKQLSDDDKKVYDKAVKNKNYFENELKRIESDIRQYKEIIDELKKRDTLSKEEREAAKEVEKRKDDDERNRFRKKFGSITDFENSVIKKNNQLEPSILSFTMKYHTKGGSFEDTKIALAVKTVSHLIQSDEMCHYINETLTQNKKFFRAIQILTGEKEFSLRFLLHLDKAKRDAKADSTTVKWWRHLKDRRAASWYKAAMVDGKPFVPNATILMSYEDYEQLKIMYKKDLIKDTKLAWKLTDLLFLMHLVIVNDVNDEIMIFNKDTRNWETYTLNKLQTEINTLNKMGNQKSLR